ncbi:MAG: GNAT family N-acetyltransferase, partial [Pseudomonadota bacterium]
MTRPGMTRPGPPPERLETAHLLLRRTRPADAPALYAQFGGDPQVTRFLSWRPHASPEATAAVLAEFDTAWDTGREHVCAICPLGSEDRPMGTISLRPQGHIVEF